MYIQYISVNDVIQGVQRLKLGKSDGEKGLNSGHIISYHIMYTPRILYVLLTLVFNSMYSMLVGIMVAVLKQNMSTTY